MRYFIDTEGRIAGQVISDHPANPQGFQILDIEALPAHWQTCRIVNGVAVIDPELVTQSNQKAAAIRRTQILAELQRIDASGARASRAIALAMVAGAEPADADVATIENLESQAVDLRADLAALAIAQ